MFVNYFMLAASVLHLGASVWQLTAGGKLLAAVYFTWALGDILMAFKL